MQPKRLFIVDAMAMAFRSFYAFGLGRPLTTSSGLPVAAVFGSAVFMNKLLTEQKPDYLAVACDSREPTFRHKLYDQYKANRTEMPPELRAQLPHFYRLLEAYGVPVLRQGGLEADDLIGSLAKRYGGPDLHVYIVSGDKDFCQLVNDHVFVYTPKKGDEALIVDRAGVQAKFGVLPEQVIDCLAIIGDTSDNVPGVHGIGEKGAARLIGDYGTLDRIYEKIGAIGNAKLRNALEASRDMAFLSRELVTIKCDVELPYELHQFECHPERSVANEALLDLFRELEFKTMAAKIEAALKLPGAVPMPPTLAAVPNGEQTAPGNPADAAGQAAIPAAEPAPSYERIGEQAPGYRLANTPETLAEVVQALTDAREFCFDTETTGLDLVTDRPIGISLSVRKDEAWYVPLAAKHLSGLEPADVLKALKPALAGAGRLKIGHNLKFDLQMLANVGLEVEGPFVDTMLCDWLLDSAGRQHGLDACCLKHLSYEKIPTSKLIGDKGQFPMLDADLGELTRYACEDADLTLRLYHCLMPRVTQAGIGNVLRDIEMPLVPILGQMERTGIYIDTNDLALLSSKLGELTTKLEGEIHALAGETFNIASPKQLSDVLFTKMRVHDQLGIRHLKKTKTGYSTDESVLQRLSEHPLARALLEYRTVTKLKGTYVDALPAIVHKDTSRLHTSFHQTGTATGRLSSSDPNLQNIPVRSPLGQEIRKAFKAKDPDWVVLSADYSQIELRILAHLAGEESLARAFAEKQDIHRATAAKVFGVEPAAVDSVMRSRAKAINFGILYGMGARRLAAETGVTLAEAAAFIDRYFASYPGISKFIDATVAEVRQTGITRTLTGRQREVEGMRDFNQRNVAAAENIAVNTRIQGSAADLIKLAMIAVDRELKRSDLKCRMLLQVHDELVFECPRSEVDKASALIRYWMENAMQLSVPLDVQVGVGANWLEAH